jgi:NarL family two-component system response regulator LiaR
MRADVIRGRDAGRHVARVVIVDDHLLARAGLRSLLNAERWLTVIGEATNGREALTVCRGLQPDLILMDVRMPEMDGLTVCRAIKQEWPQVRVVLVTFDGGPGTVIDALRSGADAYIVKGTPRREFLAVVREVVRGTRSIHPTLADWLLEMLSADEGAATVRSSLGVTPIEHEALRLRAAGASHPAIAKALRLTSRELTAVFEQLRARLTEPVDVKDMDR